ncbi:hypothetical protein T12_4533 [Trichinella patagoniensis]|uniref:Uncharacterized protein n=1 Tax=Trichinella patagoniensis TaxID=990121 RepID=A0A0V0Z2E2_9BILA|nr:hypothetical protein T12_4533 [Trichinella patagoniensis]
MQGSNRNSGSFSACTQPAESSGAGNNIQKSNPCRLSDKRKAISMRLEEAHGRMEPYAVMELMTAVFNSPDAIPLNR